MRMTGEQRIDAPRQQVWAALNDPEVLRRCLPGCQSLEKVGDDRLEATMAIKIGPIGARFAGAVTLADIDPPKGYTLRGEGQGGIAGFANGAAKVRLAEDAGATVLSYDVDAQVGGRLAQLGGPILDATGKQLAGSFFRQFGEIVAGAQAADAPPRETAAPSVQPRAAAPATRAPATATGLPVWVLALVVAALVGFLIGRSPGGATGSDWAGLAIGLLIVIVAAAAFEFGRRAATPTVTLDAELLDRLAALARRDA